MAKTSVALNFAVADYPHTRAIVAGRIPIEGVAPNFIKVEPQIAAYRRMVRNVEFDVCEIAPTTYIMARALGAPFVALPIFVSRGFHHGGLVVRPDANIKVPKDLEGKKVGVRAYSVTTGVWTRGIYIDEYGLDTSKVTWVVDDEEHVTALKLPPNVVQCAGGNLAGRDDGQGRDPGRLLRQRGHRSRRQSDGRLDHAEPAEDRLSRADPQRQGGRGGLVQEDRHLPDARHPRGQGQRAEGAPVGGAGRCTMPIRQPRRNG